MRHVELSQYNLQTEDNPFDLVFCLKKWLKNKKIFLFVPHNNELKLLQIICEARRNSYPKLRKIPILMIIDSKQILIERK